MFNIVNKSVPKRFNCCVPTSFDEHVENVYASHSTYRIGNNVNVNYLRVSCQILVALLEIYN